MADYGNNNDNYYPNNNYDNYGYYGSGAQTNWEVHGMNYDEWMEMKNANARARQQIKNLSKNAVAAQMILTGRGPKSRTAPIAAPRPRTEANIIANTLVKHFPKLNAEYTEANKEAAKQNLMYQLTRSAAPVSSEGAMGGAGAAAAPVSKENTSTLTHLPNEARRKIASFLSGNERNHLRTIKNKIRKEQFKLLRKRSNTRRRR